MSQDVGTIKEHELETVWEHEERDFTRWLAKNIELLGNELGIELEDAQTEQSVGDFSTDIVAREMNSGETVVIENQYGQTDHDHLGKLLTYSSGNDAGFTIWLAEKFRPEHRSVLEWLNESGPREAKFFGIKPRVLSVDDPNRKGFEFSVEVEPNDWDRVIGDESLSETEKAYVDFFGDLVDRYADHRRTWSALKPGTRNYLTFSAGKTGLRFGWVFHQGPEFSVELYIETLDGAQNEAIFEALEAERAEIESSLDTELVWQLLPDKQACRIKWPQDLTGKITSLEEDQRSNLIQWGVNAMDRFQDEFEPRIERLEVD